MASIFRKDDKFYDKPNRNNFDLSFQNNFTLNAGDIVPVFCKEVIPGDSFRIDPTFGIRAMPLVWPIQTRMKAYLHFYYVRNRNLWKDWPDFISGTKQDLVPPYIYLDNNNRDIVNTGSIGDYFGIPTVTYGEFGSTNQLQVQGYYMNIDGSYDNDYVAYLDPDNGVPERGNDFAKYYSKVPRYGTRPTQRAWIIVPLPGDTDRLKDYSLSIELAASSPVDYSRDTTLWAIGDDWTIVQGLVGFTDTIEKGSSKELTANQLGFFSDENRQKTKYIGVLLNMVDFVATANGAPNDVLYFVVNTSYSVGSSFGLENSDADLSNLPFISDSNVNGLRLSSMPFRAYESIYNCFYRNAENNPLIGADGQPEYNKWILNNEGGADTTHYKLRQRNWEDDFLTTALPSPQQGNAPLVGLTGTATISMASEDGTETITATTDELGNITSLSSGNENLSDALAQMLDYGISINDFRNVNALQRWLENNIRRGYKYQDQIQTHYGVSVRYDELDMPEFIGGSSQSFVVNQISQTVSSENQVLGDYAGQTSCVGSGNAITHYCDEHGYIIGVICISPVPNYSQLLPKHFLKADKFDFFFPEFGHIGPQPIPLKEITPLQTFRQQQADASVTLDDTFGYQRAWYEYLASVDEVHGLFRNQLRNFVMNRTFDTTPELGAEFTTIDPEQLNDVFAVQDTNHKFLGQVYFDVSAKRPIPLYGIPKLE